MFYQVDVLWLLYYYSLYRVQLDIGHPLRSFRRYNTAEIKNLRQLSTLYKTGGSGPSGQLETDEPGTMAGWR